MRIAPFLISFLLTAGLIFGLNTQWGRTPPLGKFVGPKQGCCKKSEPADKDFATTLSLPGLKDKAEVYFDEYLIPHVYANSQQDACFVQGYLHAKFRLWQMEFQTHAAAGRLSEILGPGPNNGYVKFDREMRRLGMVYGAEKALAEIEKDSVTKKDCDAYTAGVNEYISHLKESELPLEYKLLNYKPEPWPNLKIALFLKNMAYDLPGSDDDVEVTNAKHLFSQEHLANPYPSAHDHFTPI